MKVIRTPFGSISTDVSLFPIYYLIFIYGFLYILPYGENIVGLPWFYYFKKEDGILESLQCIQYLVSSVIGLAIYFRIKKKKSLNSSRLIIYLKIEIISMNFFMTIALLESEIYLVQFLNLILHGVTILRKTNLLFEK